MARILLILDAAQRREFDHQPKLTYTQRKLFFDVLEWGEAFLRTLVAAHSRDGFVLQVGYFKATGRFFSAERFLAADKEFVQQHYQVGSVDWTRYDWTTTANHRQHILR